MIGSDHAEMSRGINIETVSMMDRPHLKSGNILAFFQWSITERTLAVTFALSQVEKYFYYLKCV